MPAKTTRKVDKNCWNFVELLENFSNYKFLAKEPHHRIDRKFIATENMHSYGTQKSLKNCAPWFCIVSRSIVWRRSIFSCERKKFSFYFISAAAKFLLWKMSKINCYQKFMFLEYWGLIYNGCVILGRDVVLIPVTY